MRLYRFMHINICRSCYRKFLYHPRVTVCCDSHQCRCYQQCQWIMPRGPWLRSPYPVIIEYDSRRKIRKAEAHEQRQIQRSFQFALILWLAHVMSSFYSYFSDNCMLSLERLLLNFNYSFFYQKKYQNKQLFCLCGSHQTTRYPALCIKNSAKNKKAPVLSDHDKQVLCIIL